MLAGNSAKHMKRTPDDLHEVLLSSSPHGAVTGPAGSITRRDFCRLSGVALGGVSLAGAESVDPGTQAPGTQASLVGGYAPDELQRMFVNPVRLPRPDTPCPLPQSGTIRGVTYTGRYRDYPQTTGADTFMTSWAANGNLYATYADGFATAADVSKVSAICTLQSNHWYFRRLGIHSPLEPGSVANPPVFEKTSESRQATHTGNAILIGDDPFDLTIHALPPTPLRMTEYPACYPSGCLVRDDIWMTACHYRAWSLDSEQRQLCYEQGPARFRFSPDYGKSWQWSPHDDRKPVIPELGRPAGGAPIKLGTAKFVDFGRNMEHSPDGLAYLVGHGSSDPKGVSNWSSGDAMYIARVSPAIEAINDPSAYEYYAGPDPSGKPQWSREFARIRPVFEWPCRCGLPSITYFPSIRKYLAVFCVGWPDGVDGQYDTWIAEADELHGPWSLVTYWNAFADQAYFAQIPSKFIQADGRFMLFYSGGWSGVKPLPPEWRKQPAIPELPNAAYALCVAEFRLELS